MTTKDSFEDHLREHALPLSAIADIDVREQVKLADVVFGIEGATYAINLFYGRAYLQRFAEGEAEQPEVIAFHYDQKAGELEYLAEACKTLKGECDYDGEVLSPN